MFPILKLSSPSSSATIISYKGNNTSVILPLVKRHVSIFSLHMLMNDYLGASGQKSDPSTRSDLCGRNARKRSFWGNPMPGKKAKFHLARVDSTRHDSTRSTCRAHAFWLCRASRTAQLDSLDTTSSTGSTGSTRRARRVRLAT